MAPLLVGQPSLRSGSGDNEFPEASLLINKMYQENGEWKQGDLWGPIKAELDALQDEMARIQREEEDLHSSTQPPEYGPRWNSAFPTVAMERHDEVGANHPGSRVMHAAFPGLWPPDELVDAGNFPLDLDLPRAPSPLGEPPVSKIELPPGVEEDFSRLFRLGGGKAPDRKHIDLIRAIIAGDPDMRGALEDMERPDLSRFHGRPRYDSATGTMVRVPPQLRGKHGFSDDPIQKVHPELAAMIPELKGRVSEEDALAVFESGETSLGRAIRPAELGPETIDTAPISGSGGYRFVPPSLDDARINIPMPPGWEEGDPRPSPSNRYLGDRGQTAAMFDPRFHMVSPTTGRLIPRGDQSEQYEEAMSRGRWMPSPTRGLAAGFTRPPGYSDRRRMWLEDRDKRRDTKASRLRSRRKLMHRKAMAQHNIADQTRANQPSWMNVPRFPGESDNAYAARYAAFAQMMGQGMGRPQPNYPGGDNAMMGPLLNYILGQSQGRDADRQNRRLLIMKQVGDLRAEIAAADALSMSSRGFSDETDEQRARKAELKRKNKELDEAMETSGRGGGGFNPFGGGY